MMDEVEVEIAIAPYVNAEFYYENYPDVRAQGSDPVRHYSRNGWKEGRNPNPWFSTNEYLRLHRDVALSGVNPFWHYITHGRAEERPLRLPPKKAKKNTSDRDLYKPFFDADYYSKQVLIDFASEDAALDHFVAEGDLGLIDPHPLFSSEFYHMQYIRTKEVKESPLLHFIKKGRKQGLLPNPMLGPKLKRIDEAESASDATQSWLQHLRPILLSSDAISERITEVLPNNSSAIYFSFSHDDYLLNTGGIQLCLAHENNHARQAGDTYIHISPLQAMLHIDDETDSRRVRWNISVNGKAIGTTTAADFICGISPLVENSKARKAVIVHHLLGHSTEAITELVKATQPVATYYWLHDYLFACEQYNLLRNNAEFCSAPPIESNACMLCVHGKRRQKHLDTLSKFFDKHKPVVLAPSQSVADAWNAHSALAYESLHVVPHCIISERGKTASFIDGDAKYVRPLRIAYIGYPVYQKGWDAFETLAWVFRDDERYEFVHLGETESHCEGVKFVNTRASASKPNATVETLQEQTIDAVVIWANWPETFSIVTTETLAAGAFVITRPQSGNTHALAVKSGRGLVADNKSDLIAKFANHAWYEQMIEAFNSGVSFGELDYSSGLTIAFDREASKKAATANQTKSNRNTTSKRVVQKRPTAKTAPRTAKTAPRTAKTTPKTARKKMQKATKSAGTTTARRPARQNKLQSTV